MSKTIMNVPNREITKAPVKFLFKDDEGLVECTLEIYKRTITLYPKNKVKGITVRISKLTEILEDLQRKRRRHRK